MYNVLTLVNYDSEVLYMRRIFKMFIKGIIEFNMSAVLSVLCGIRDRTNPQSGYCSVQQQKATSLDDVNGLPTTNHVRVQAASPSNTVTGCLQLALAANENHGTGY